MSTVIVKCTDGDIRTTFSDPDVVLVALRDGLGAWQPPQGAEVTMSVSKLPKPMPRSQGAVGSPHPELEDVTVLEVPGVGKETLYPVLTQLHHQMSR